MMSLAQGEYLVRLARESISSEFTGSQEKVKREGWLEEKRGVFVTLTKRGELRGCIGFPEPILPLGKAVIEAARAAAFEDPRFRPLIRDELDKISIDVSVLTLPRKIDCPPESYPARIRIGIDGLIIRQGQCQGLLLPQVAVECGWKQEEYLAHLCMKAGLRKDAWKRDCELYSFQAQVFREGKVKEACQPIRNN